MSTDIDLAFAHPVERARDTAQSQPLDRISLRDHVVEVEIGAFQLERGTTQRISFNVVVEVRAPSEALRDDVDRILSYDKVTDAISFELARERLDLLETLAERVADRILMEPQAARVFVRIEKLDRGPGALGVEIVRARHQADDVAIAAQDSGDYPRPQVVFLSDAAIASPNLERWIDQLATGGVPVVLCVGLPEAGGVTVDDAAAQRRIDLLAIDQNAWRVAARDKRCTVVNTRTELDWTMRHSAMSIWAPSKIVLDSPDGNGIDPRETMAMILWFAGLLKARDILVIGAQAPQAADLPVRAIALMDETI